MKESVVAELRVGRGGPADAWRYYLPENSRVTEEFADPVSIILKGGVMTAGQPPQNPGHRMKVFIGETPRWGNTDVLIGAFAQLWPETLQCIAGLRSDVANLVYFSAEATHDDLFSLWPCLPFEHPCDKRFFVQAWKDSHTQVPWGRLCVEYSYENLRRIVGPDGYGFPYGATIMGVSITESRVAEYLRMNFLDKAALENALNSENVRCWWFCDADFEGMTIWHKDISGPNLQEKVRQILPGK